MSRPVVNTNLRHAANAIRDYLKAQSYGTFVAFQTLNDIAGVNVRSPKFRYILDYAKRDLLRHHDRVLVSVRGEGYEIATTTQCVSASSSYRKRSYKAAKTAFAITRTIDLSKLSDAERNRVVTEQCKAGALLVTYSACENKLLNGPDSPKLITAPTETEIVRMLLDKSK
jgi:hypothetical protein